MMCPLTRSPQSRDFDGILGDNDDEEGIQDGLQTFVFSAAQIPSISSLQLEGYLPARPTNNIPLPIPTDDACCSLVDMDCEFAGVASSLLASSS